MFDINQIPIINGCRYIITHHVREKMRERFNSKCNPCDIKGGNAEVNILLHSAIENKSIYNNTNFIANMYTKYGPNQRIKFMQSDTIIFIAVAHKEFANCFVLVTCYDGNTSSKSHFIQKKRKF